MRVLGSSGIKLGEARPRPHQPGPHLFQKRGPGRRSRASPPSRRGRAGPGGAWRAGGRRGPVAQAPRPRWLLIKVLALAPLQSLKPLFSTPAKRGESGWADRDATARPGSRRPLGGEGGAPRTRGRARAVGAPAPPRPQFPRRVREGCGGPTSPSRQTEEGPVCGRTGELRGGGCGVYKSYANGAHLSLESPAVRPFGESHRAPG